MRAGLAGWEEVYIAGRRGTQEALAVQAACRTNVVEERDAEVT